MPAQRIFMSSKFQNFLREQCSFTTTCRVIKALLKSGKPGEDLPEPNPVTFILLSLPSLMPKSEMLSLRHLQTFEIFNPLPPPRPKNCHPSGDELLRDGRDGTTRVVGAQQLRVARHNKMEIKISDVADSTLATRVFFLNKTF